MRGGKWYKENLHALQYSIFLKLNFSKIKLLFKRIGWEVGGGSRFRNSCTPVAVSYQCMKTNDHSIVKQNKSFRNNNNKSVIESMWLLKSKNLKITTCENQFLEFSQFQSNFFSGTFGSSRIVSTMMQH